MRGLITGEYYQTELNLQSLTKPFLLNTPLETEPFITDQLHVFTLSGLAKTTPIFDITYFPSNYQDSLISMPTLLQLTSDQYSSVTELPMRFMILELVDGITDDQLDEVIRYFFYLWMESYSIIIIYTSLFFPLQIMSLYYSRCVD